MIYKKLTSIALAVLIFLSFMCSASAYDISEVWPHSTQFPHEKSNPSWMSDFKVGEKPGLIDMLMNRNVLIPKPTGYKYIHTPETFKKEVEQYVEIYELDETSYRAAYINVMELLNKFSSSLYADVSDEYIKSWLEASGIVYPENGLSNDETVIFARALYTVLKSNSKFAETIPSGYKLEAAIVAYIGYAFDKDLGELAPWDSNANLDTLQKYIIAVSKVGLHSQGYEINANTSDETVYKMTAVMLIETAGYAIDIENASLEELQIKYLAAMLNKAYDVHLSPDLLEKALKGNYLPLYILQAMGQTKNLVIKNNTKYEDAFNLIAENTTYFDLAQDEFYSDVYNYEVYLEYIRDAIWIWPKSLMKDDEKSGQSVKILVNGREVKDDLASKVPLNEKLRYQTVYIVVVYTKGKEEVKSTYKLKVNQGDIKPPETNDSPNQKPKEPITFPVFDAISDLFTKPNEQTGQSNSVSMPARIQSILTMFAPSFGNGETASPFDFLTGILDFDPFDLDNAYGGDKSTLGGIGGADIGYTTPQNEQTSYFANSGSNSPLAYGTVIQHQNANTENIESTPYKHIAELSAPPKGYTYITDSRGYVLGLAMRYDSSAPAINSNIGTGKTSVAENIFANIKWLTIPTSLSLLGIFAILMWRKKSKFKAD